MYRIPGASWPHKLNIKEEEKKELSEIYFNFKKESISEFGRICSLKPHLLSQKVFELATRNEILNEIEKLIGKNINIWSSAFFVKEPKKEKYVGFHQDAPYWQLSSSNVVTAWIALSDSIIENGCLQFIESSNKDREESHPLDIEDAYSTYKKGKKTTNADDLISYKQLIPEKYLRKKIHYVELNSGEYSLHDISVIHGSSKNKSQKYRLGFAVRYIDSETYHIKDKQDTALNVRGDKSKFLQNEVAPIGEFTSSNVLYYSKFIKSAGGFGNKSY